MSHDNNLFPDGTESTKLIVENKEQSNEGFRDSSSIRAVLDEIKIIQDWNGQVLFLFGRRQTGKSSILGSLMYYMNTADSKGRIVPVNIIPDGYAFYTKSIQSLSVQKLPGRTSNEKPIAACVEFTPLDAANDPLRLAILEISGEDLEKVETETGFMGDFSEEIKLYLNVEDFKIGFVLVTTPETAQEDDKLMSAFINYLLNLPRKFDMTRVLLLISKWDLHKGNRTADDFVKRVMPLTYGSLVSRNGALGTYSVGTVVDLDGAPHVAQMDKDAPKRFLRWMYKHFKNRDLYHESWFRRLLNSLS